MKPLLFIGFAFLTSCISSEEAPLETAIFNGENLNGWHLFNEGDVPSIWFVEDGLLTCDPVHEGTFGDLVTSTRFEDDFTFTCDWKVGSGGNSGIFIGVVDEEWAAPWMSGVEYQILDHSDSLNHNYNDPKRMSGALYGFQEVPQHVPYHQDGWNHTRIEVKKNELIYFLNGVQTAKVDVSSKQWTTMVQESKFREYPDFGKRLYGRIALQAWKGRVQFKNLKISY